MTDRRPYEPFPLDRRYAWAKAEREREDAFWPGKYSDTMARPHRERVIFPRMNRGAFRPKRFATAQWFGGERFYRTDHYQMKAVRDQRNP